MGNVSPRRPLTWEYQDHNHLYLCPMPPPRGPDRAAPMESPGNIRFVPVIRGLPTQSIDLMIVFVVPLPSAHLFLGSLGSGRVCREAPSSSIFCARIAFVPEAWSTACGQHI